VKAAKPVWVVTIFFGPEHRFYRFQRLFRGRIGKMAARFFSNFFKIAGLKSGDAAI